MIIGTLSGTAAEKLGFKGTVKVVTGGHDMVCAAVGSGLDEEQPEAAVDISGTIEGIVVAMKEPNTSEEMMNNKLPCYPGMDGYVTFSVNLTAGCIVRWFREMIVPDVKDAAQKDGVSFYDYMLDKIDTSGPGTLIMLPHFSGSGSPYFDPDALGVFYGLTLDTDRQDMGRAIIEGLTLDVGMQVKAFGKAGIAIDTLKVTGGGAGSDTQLQIKANITGLKIVRGAAQEASAMGAAAYAATAMGLLDNPADVYKMKAGGEKVFFPDTESFGRWQYALKRYKRLSASVQSFECTPGGEKNSAGE
jgi:xylulokinase